MPNCSCDLATLLSFVAMDDSAMSDPDPNDPDQPPPDGPVVLFAGGGTGGHIYPNVAVAERLLSSDGPGRARPHFLISSRSGDREILDRLGYSYTVSPVQPLPPLTRPWHFFSFFFAWRRAVAQVRRLLVERQVAAVVATGGYVSGPAVVVARKSTRIPCALVNLDAVPGVANRRLVRYKPSLFAVRETPLLPGARLIGLPMRRASLGDPDADPAQARAALGLDPDRPVLFITGATHGAVSIIQGMMALIQSEHARIFDGWQVFHQCGMFDVAELERAYEKAGIPAKVVAHCDQMGTAWRAADLAISRAGAGSVAEAWANATPTIFLPNPYHRDQHQKHNAQPVVDTGGARMITDRIEPEANVPALAEVLAPLMGDPEALQSMARALVDSRPPDGAAALADWIAENLDPAGH